ncbi:hypothetical protein [Oryzibacter oryziterrae]|uniref:hypothetical protein n=1 Tax=Oryzibacter oryziterrae TaxID=2766474 RepID=UPI001F166543|nr:hypothetical protein [Oryzibacter oryziterrae]
MVSGEDHRLFSTTRNSGLGSSLGSSVPVIKTLGDIGNLLTNIGASALRSDQNFDQKDASMARDFIPFARTIGILNATNWLITSTLPKRADGPLIKKAE